LPLTPNGKLDTRALPAPDYTDTDHYRAPSTPTEEILASIYARVLGLERVSVDDSFFDLGGDSLSAMRLIAAINTALDTHLTVRTFFLAPSVRTLSQQLGRPDSDLEVVPVEVLQEGTGVPLCCVHGGFGISWTYRSLAKYLDCPIIGISQIPQDGEAEPTSVRSIAANYADRLQAIYPDGPYNLLGWSIGGLIAHELAIELQRRGCEVQRLVLLDSVLVTSKLVARYIARRANLAESTILEYILRGNGIDSPTGPNPLTYQQADEIIHQQDKVKATLPPRQLLDFMVKCLDANTLYMVEHVPAVFNGDMVMFTAKRFTRLGSQRRGWLARMATRPLARMATQSRLKSWRPYVTGNIKGYKVDCVHYEMLSSRSLRLYGPQLKLLLETSDLGKHSLPTTPIAAIDSMNPNRAVRTILRASAGRSSDQQLGRHTNAAQVSPVEVLKEGTGVPLCCIHDGFGLSWPYRALGKYLDCPITGINQVPQNGEPQPRSIHDMAAAYADRLQAVHPEGPYRLLGWSFGGIVAHELAIELRRRGCEVECLVLLDAALIVNKLFTRFSANMVIVNNRFLAKRKVMEYISRTNCLDIPVRLGTLTNRPAEGLIDQEKVMDLVPSQLFDLMLDSVSSNQSRLLKHVPDVFDGDAVIFSATRLAEENGSNSGPKLPWRRLQTRAVTRSRQQSWRPYIAGDITEYAVDCTHDQMLTSRSVDAYGPQLKLLLETYLNGDS
jgi:thioesterase domain-containing protein/acyl carrier protein